MKRFLALAFCCLFFLMGCTPKTVISSTYDFDQVQRIGIMSFENRYAALRGVENLFASLPDLRWWNAPSWKAC